ADAVHDGRPPEAAVPDAAGDRVALRPRSDDAGGALLLVAAVVADPLLAEHQPAEAVGPFFHVAAVAVAVVGVLVPAAEAEGVCRGADAKDRLAAFQVVVDRLHLFRRQVAHPGED